MTSLDVVLVACAAPLCIATGFSLLRAVAPRLTLEETVVASVGAGCGLLGGAQFVAYGLGVAAHAGLIAATVVGVAAASPGIARGARRPWLGDRSAARHLGGPTLVMVVLAVVLLTLSFAVPVYIGGHWSGDWWWHWLLARKWALASPPELALVERTPLYNLVHACFIWSPETPYAVFQVVNAWLSAAFVLPAWLLARRLWGERLALPAVAALVVNPWVVHLAWFPWPKMLTVYFVLTAAHFAISARDAVQSGGLGARGRLILAGVYGAGAYLTHPLALTYLAGLAAYLVVSGAPTRRLLERVRDAALLGSTAALATLPWYAWGIATFGWLQVGGATPAFWGPRGLSVPARLVSVLHNAVFTVIPMDLVAVRWENLDGARLLEPIFNVYFNPLPGAVTATGLVGLAGALAWRAVSRREPTGHRHGLRVWLLAAAVALGLATLAVAALLLVGTAATGIPWYGAEDFSRLERAAWALVLAVGALSVAAARWRWRLPSDHAVVAVLAMVGTAFAGGVLLHPGPDWAGVFHNTMPATGVLLALGVVAMLARLDGRLRAAASLGLIGEGCLGIWVYAALAWADRIYPNDPNVAEKLAQGLYLLADTAVGQAAAPALALAGAVASIALCAGVMVARGGAGDAMPLSRREAR